MPKIATVGVYEFDSASFVRTLDEAAVTLIVDIRQRRGVRGPQYAWANAGRLQALLADAPSDTSTVGSLPQRPSCGTFNIATTIVRALASGHGSVSLLTTSAATRRRYLITCRWSHSWRGCRSMGSGRCCASRRRPRPVIARSWPSAWPIASGLRSSIWSRASPRTSISADQRCRDDDRVRTLRSIGSSPVCRRPSLSDWSSRC